MSPCPAAVAAAMPLAAALAVVARGLHLDTRQRPRRRRAAAAPVAQGGTLTVGVWQAPTTLLDAGIVGNLPFADVIAAPVEEGLLWYRADDRDCDHLVGGGLLEPRSRDRRCRRWPTAAS